MDALPAFELFLDPAAEGVIKPSDQTCSCCRTARGFIYDAELFSPSPQMDDWRICPWCIADGSAAKHGLSFNDSTIYPLFDSTPQMSPDDRALVEGRTPGFVTWQGNHWLMCCGRACVYLGEADSSDLLGRWNNAVHSIFDGEGRSPEEIKQIVASIKRGRSPCAYVFCCQTCKTLRGYWDCD